MAMDFHTMHSFPGMAFPMRCSNDGDDEEQDQNGLDEEDSIVKIQNYEKLAKVIRILC